MSPRVILKKIFIYLIFKFNWTSVFLFAKSGNLSLGFFFPQNYMWCGGKVWDWNWEGSALLLGLILWLSRASTFIFTKWECRPRYSLNSSPMIKFINSSCFACPWHNQRHVMGHGWELLVSYFPAPFKRAVAERLGISPCVLPVAGLLR